MSKRDFYFGSALYIFTGVAYIGGIVLNCFQHNFDAACGFFCAVCMLAVAFLWFCESKRLRERLDEIKPGESKSDGGMKTYWFVFRATTADGASTAYGTTVGKAYSLNERICSVAKDTIIEKLKEDGFEDFQEPIMLNVVKLDE